jgi:hypothetical protein
MSEAKKDEPLKRVRVGSVNGAIWSNKSQDGKKTFLKATFQSTYKDKNGELQNTQSYSLSELLELAKCADMTHTQMLKMYADMPRGEAPEATTEEAAA